MMMAWTSSEAWMGCCAAIQSLSRAKCSGPFDETAQLYANGSLALAQPISAGSFVPGPSGDLYFGSHAAPTAAGTVSFKGGLDEFSVYERALCDCEIAAIAGVTNRGKYGTNVLIC